MSGGVRIYFHTKEFRPVRQCFPGKWEYWITHFYGYRNLGLKIVAIGSEEGAMAVHFR